MQRIALGVPENVPQPPRLTVESLAAGGEGAERISSQAVLIRSPQGNPIAIFTVVGAQLVEMHSAFQDRDEFYQASRRHGIETPSVATLSL